MTDHRQTIAAFLTTDLLRLEAALEEQPWSEGVAQRLTGHLHRLEQLLTLMHAATVPAPSLDSTASALLYLMDSTHALIKTLLSLPDGTLNARVLDPHRRDLTLLGHLYDYTRLSAMLVEWSQHLAPPATLNDWFDESE